MPKKYTRRDALDNHKSARYDEDGAIRNGFPAGYYVPRDPERRARLWRALGWTTVNGGNTIEDKR